MAGTILTNINIRGTNGNLDESYAPAADSIVQTAVGSHATVWNVGTSAEALSLGDLTAPGQVAFFNLDATNFCEIGTLVGSTFMRFAQLNPGEQATFPMSSATTLAGKADTAAVNLKVFALSR